MKTIVFPKRMRGALPALAALLMGLFAPPALAYPPALPHTFHGMVRDELGNPLPAGAAITFEAASGVKIYGVVSSVFEPGTNYRLRVPMDAALTSDAYKPTALNPAAPFKIKVTIGNTTYLPIEMTHDFKFVGLPGKSTLLNLTLGEDSNGDGLPDAWQRRINSDLSAVSPTGDSDHDGLSNLQEYLAGTYAYDPASGFLLSIVRFQNNAPVLAFTSISGRSYSILGSSDLNSEAWSPVQFKFTMANSDATPRASFTASEVLAVQVEVVTSAGEPVPQFFKLMLE